MEKEVAEVKETRRIREIARWEREKARPRGRYYIAYLVLIISLIYLVDEVASQIGMLMKTEIANDLFARFGESSVGALEILAAIGLPFQILGLLYRPLADKWGRRVFLVVNTFGMSVALLLIYLSRSVPVYFIGACLVQFFIPHDMHVVYIMETTPPKHRAKIYSSVKFVATMGIMLVPLLRRLLMESAAQWRRVYLLPAIIGLVASFVALLLARETDAFMDGRLRYLRLSETERQQEKQEAQNAQGGLWPALRFAWSHRQLKWLYIASALANVGFIGTLNYQVILSYGFARGIYGGYDEAAMNAVSVGAVTEALLLFPVGCALSQLVMGFVSDRYGRKAAAMLVAFQSLASFLGFFFGARWGLNPYAVGLLCGACIGSYYALNDVINMMVGESSPTNLRSSTMSAQFVVTLFGGILSYAVGLPVLALVGNRAMGVLSLGLMVPGFALSLLALWRCTHDTRGADLDSVTGCEWD